ncbi:uncharacterized protein LOC135351978 isoform X3 [Halichondria panicea]|uniref:uncharacterized protein LOC135351978 isoform X3 n=1 Tax=Halichondria panicea TaxID=6063 RepID=UPI00312B5753
MASQSSPVLDNQEPIVWKKWLEDNAHKMCKGNLSAKEVYGELLHKRDRLFNGTATHGLARSCGPCSSFTQFEDMKKIVSEMPKEQLIDKDDDGDLPVHSALNSMAKQNMIALFVQGDSEEKTILSTKNHQGKTPIELAVDNLHNSAIELLYNLCVKHNILPGLTGFEQSGSASTILHTVFCRDDTLYWSNFLSVVINACKRAARDILPTITVLDERNCTPFYYLMNCMNPNHHYKLAGFEKVLVLLRDNEIDVNAVVIDSKKRTMLHAARRKHHDKCSEMLSRYGHKDDIEDIDKIKPFQRDHHITKFNSFSLSPTASSETLEVEQHAKSGNLEDTHEAMLIPIATVAQQIDRGCFSTSLLEYPPSPLTALESQSLVQDLKDVHTKVGEEATFSIVTSSGQFSYNWCLNDQSIPDDNPDYRGATSNKLVVLKPLSKHCGSYKCIVTNKHHSGVHISSTSARLTVDGTKIEVEESKLLHTILTSMQIDKLGIELDSGTSNVTYEELQIIFGQTLQTSYLSTDLQQRLTARIEDDKIYEEAIKNDDIILLFYLKMLAIGPGQIGKSTFVRRLLGIMKWDISEDPDKQPPGSTGLSEYKEAFLVYNHESVALSTEQSWEIFGESDIGKELSALVSLLASQTKSRKAGEMATAEKPEKTLSTSDHSSDSVPPNHTSDTADIAAVSTNESSQSTNYSVFEQSPTASSCPELQNLPQSEIDQAYKEFEELRTKLSNSPNDNVESLHAIINIVDVGGQPAFLELLPSLTIGPAMYLVFMKLLWELQTPQDTKCKFQNDKKASICENFKYTPEEVIFTALSCIECFGHSDEEVEKYIEDPANNKKINSLVLIMGTYADDLTSGDKNGEEKAEEIVKETNKQLHAKLETTSFYKNDQIEYHNNKSDDLEVLFPINNKSGGKPEVDKYRRIITDLIESRFRKYNIPARWLMFSICLKILAQKKKRKVIEFTDCVEIGKRFKMNKENVQVALRFLHKYIGLVMYFQKDEKLKLLKDIVICDPQAVFTSISELIFNIYDPPYRNVGSSVILRFRQRGFFCPKDHNIEANVTQENHLPIEELLPLLEYLNIVVPIVMDSIDGYFLPAVLQAATSEVLNEPLKGADPDKDPEPLCVRFKTGFVPLGFVSALVANLLNGNKDSLDLLGKEQSSIVYKNKITFRFRGRYNIVLISRAKYCEFRVSRAPGAAVDEEFCCPLIKDMLQKSIKDVIDRMRQRSLFQLSQGYDFAFKCPQSDCKKKMGNESLAVFNLGDHLESLKCESCRIAISATPKMSTWLPKDLAGVDHGDIDDNQKNPGITSLHKLMVKQAVTDEQLNREIGQDDFAPVAMHFDSVELYLHPLKLTDNEQADVKRETYLSGSNQVAVINCLSIWRGHEPSKATFRALIRILLDLGKEDIVTKICQYLKEKDNDAFREEHLVPSTISLLASGELSTERNKESTIRNRNGTESIPLPVRQTPEMSNSATQKSFQDGLSTRLPSKVVSQPQESNAYGIHSFDLPGVKVLASTCVIVTNSPQTFHWVGYGFKLTIPQGSLPAGVDQCQLDIMASVAGKYKFPYNLQLVSGVFWVRSHLPGQFQQLLTVEIQHCAKMNSTAKLSFVRARCSQKNLPYTFKQLEGSGSFTDKTSYGLLELNNFSGLAVAGKDVERERVYTASLYYFGSELHSREIHFVVSWNDEIHRTHVKKEYSSKRAVLGVNHFVEFEEDRITLDIPMAGIEVEGGWKIIPMFPPTVIKKHVDQFSGQRIPYCHLNAEMINNCKIRNLFHQVKLVGAKSPYNIVTININHRDSTFPVEQHASPVFSSVAPSPLSTEETSGAKCTQSTSTQGSSEEEHPSINSTKQSSSNPIVLTTLTICEKLKTARKDWFDLGMAFGLKYSDLKDIEDQYKNNNKRCLTEMVGRRFECTDSDHPVTWPYICECLRSPTVERNDIAEEIEVEFGPFT